MDNKTLLTKLIELRDSVDDGHFVGCLGTWVDEVSADVQCEDDEASFVNEYECEKLGKKEMGL